MCRLSNEYSGDLYLFPHEMNNDLTLKSCLMLASYIEGYPIHNGTIEQNSSQSTFIEQSEC